MANTSLEKFRNTTPAVPPPSYCGIPDVINTEIVLRIEGVLLSIFRVLGLLGNATTFYVLSKISGSYSKFNKLLIRLIFGDTISIIVVVTDFLLRKGFHVLSLSNPIYAYMWPQFIYPLIKIPYTWIMCKTIER